MQREQSVQKHQRRKYLKSIQDAHIIRMHMTLHCSRIWLGHLIWYAKSQVWWHMPMISREIEAVRSEGQDQIQLHIGMEASLGHENL